MESKAKTPRRRFRWWQGIILVLLLLTLFIPRTGGLRITPVERIAFEHIFSLVEWEVVNFPQKWLYSLTNLVPGSKPTRDERLAMVDEYLQTVRAANKEERRIEGANQLRSFRAGGSGAKAGPVSDAALPGPARP